MLETTDARPQRIAAIQQLSTAFLRIALYADNSAFADTVAKLMAETTPEGSIETK